MTEPLRGSWRALCVGAALVTIVLAAPAAAQVETGMIEVFTRDPGGLPLAGVTAEVVNSDTGLRRVAISDGRGAVTFSALPLGRYQATATLEHFAPALEGDLLLRVGQTLRLVMTMRVQVSHTISVTAKAPIVDVLKSDASANIIPEQIEDLPTPDRDFQKLALIAPGVQRDRGVNRFVYGSPVMGSAGNASQTTVMVDGVDFTDQFLGQARVRVSQDAIREFRVVNSRFDAEIGGSAAGALSVVTKSGTNEARGSVYGFYRGDGLRTTGALETGDQEVWRYHAGFTVGGPIARDSTHYFAALEYLEEAAIAPFRPGGLYQGQDEDIPRPAEQLLSLVSLTHQPSAANALDARLMYDRRREQNYRAGGPCDESCGMRLDRDNWNLTGSDTWVASERTLNTLWLMAGRRTFETGNNSGELSQWFSFGSSLQIGANPVGDQLMEGDYYELRDTLQLQPGGGRTLHDLKLGGSLRLIDERWDFPVYPQGLLIWATDYDEGPFAVPYIYNYGVGSADISIDTTLVGLFLQDDWRVRTNLSLILGLRYDLDTDGNNPDFSHPNSPGDRSVDRDNLQPRLGFVWDVSGRGSSVLRGGVGLFTGRNLLVPAGVELQQNGTTGRPTLTRFNERYLCFLAGIPPDLCPLPALDPGDPQNTGLPLPPNSAVLQAGLEAPEAAQASLGFTQRLGRSGLYLDLEALYAEGDREVIIRDVNWGGNANPVRLNSEWNVIGMYTNEGHSRYAAVMASLNGVLPGGHVLTTSVSWGDKKNIADDFSPNLGPSDPSDIGAEWGRARSDERWRVVLSGIFRLPLGFMVAPIFEYGSGTPWTRLLGYDANGDGSLADRAPGVPRNGEDGPEFRQLSLRLAKSFGLGRDRELELIVEGFNILDTTNYDPNSIDNAEFLRPSIGNQNFGSYTATLDPRVIQLGLIFHF